MSITKAIFKLTIEDLPDMFKVFGEPSVNDAKIINSYFFNDSIGYGCWDISTDVEYGYITLLGYCFIKNKSTRPETMTQVKEEYRNGGIATELRDYALNQRKEFVGNIVYSSTHNTNLACIKSLLKSGYQLFDVGKDGNLQFVKILKYDTRTN